MSITQQIICMVEQMPQKNQILILELLKSMIHDDDILSEEDEKDILQARVEFQNGDVIRHKDINWN